MSFVALSSRWRVFPRHPTFASDLCLPRRIFWLSMSMEQIFNSFVSFVDRCFISRCVVQYLRIDSISFDLHLIDQQVFVSLPSQLEYFHSDCQTTLPAIVLAKLYLSPQGEKNVLSLLSVHHNLRLTSLNVSRQITQ